MRRRGLLIVLLCLVLAVLAGVTYLGLNPPEPVTKPVLKLLPNDKFPVR